MRLCGNCGGRCKSVPLPADVAPSETLTRFIFNRRDYFADTGAPKQKAFYPVKYNGELETSVSRLDGAVKLRVPHLGKYIRHPEKAVAITTVAVSAMTEAKLTVHTAPELCYAEHAVIKGWPDRAVDPKALWKHGASVLVLNATKAVPIPE